MANGANRMVFLGFGKYARADKIYALEPLTGDDRGGGRRTRVWIEGVPDPTGEDHRVLSETADALADETNEQPQRVALALAVAVQAAMARLEASIESCWT